VTATWKVISLSARTLCQYARCHEATTNPFVLFVSTTQNTKPTKTWKISKENECARHHGTHYKGKHLQITVRSEHVTARLNIHCRCLPAFLYLLMPVNIKIPRLPGQSCTTNAGLFLTFFFTATFAAFACVSALFLRYLLDLFPLRDVLSSTVPQHNIALVNTRPQTPTLSQLYQTHQTICRSSSRWFVFQNWCGLWLLQLL
jgi:hypothetical protein